MASNPPWDRERAAEIIARHAHLEGAALPMLHAIQDAFGYVPDEAIPMLADALNFSRAEVRGTISFYHDFRREPAGRHHVHVCRAEACQSMGCERLIGHLESKLGIKLGETTNDGMFTVDPVYCLGNCALSPALMLDGKPYGRVSPEVADFLVDDVRRRG